jgi:hypothetical protein
LLGTLREFRRALLERGVALAQHSLERFVRFAQSIKLGVHMHAESDLSVFLWARR